VAASSRKGNRMTGNFEQPKHTGASAAWPEASCVSLRSQGLAQPGTNLVQAEDILTPEELAVYAFSLRSPRDSRSRGSRCPTPGFLLREDPRALPHFFSFSALVALFVASALRATRAQPGRFHACVSGATSDSIGCPGRRFRASAKLKSGFKRAWTAEPFRPGVSSPLW
jgi:hypothetical protein